MENFPPQIYNISIIVTKFLFKIKCFLKKALHNFIKIFIDILFFFYYIREYIKQGRIIMPHHKSTIKRVRTNKKRQEYNKHFKTMIRSAVKNVLSSPDKETGMERLRSTYSLLDKCARKNIIHKNNASNQKARLTKYVNSL
ncbi:30S ribosomal protein S20 [candidate division KSB1 bacterium]|nr:30S ribosomal protein S20 [candidate division KSB1 bacterium]